MNTYTIVTPFYGSHSPHEYYSSYDDVSRMEEGTYCYVEPEKKIEIVDGGLYGKFDWTYKSVNMLSNPDTGLDIINSREKKEVKFTGKVKQHDGISKKYRYANLIMRGYRNGWFDHPDAVVEIGMDLKTLCEVYGIFQDAYIRINKSQFNVPFDLSGAIDYSVNYNHSPSFEYILKVLNAAKNQMMYFYNKV